MNTRSEACTKTVFFGLARVTMIAMLLVAPLAFGAVQAWAWGSMAMLLAVSTALWAVGCARTSSLKLFWSPLYFPALGVLVVAVVQLAAGLTMDRIATREAIIKICLALVVFFLTQHLFDVAETSAWKITSGVIPAYCFGLALFAIIQCFVAPDLLYGVVRPATGGNVFGPYVNRNHYAGLFEVLIPMTTAIALSLRPKHPAKAAVVFAALVALVSVFLSGSRGGAAAVSIESAVLALIAGFRTPAGQERTRILVVGLVVVASIGAFLFWLDPGYVWKRWAGIANSPQVVAEDRLQWTGDALRMARHRWLGGVGLGAFEVAYPQYQTFRSDLVIDYAHNDYAQLLAEGGIVGFSMAATAILLFAFSARRTLRSRVVAQSGWLQLGAAVAICGVLIHSFSDFNLHIPANAAWVAFALGISTLPPGDRPVLSEKSQR